jgi:hypothetical protein
MLLFPYPGIPRRYQNTMVFFGFLGFILMVVPVMHDNTIGIEKVIFFDMEQMIEFRNKKA